MATVDQGTTYNINHMTNYNELMKNLRASDSNPALKSLIQGRIDSLGMGNPTVSTGTTPTADQLKKNPFTTTYGAAAPLDAAGRPLKPEFQSIGDTSTGLLQSQYLLKNELDPSAYNAVMQEALRPAGQQSKWAQMAQAQQFGDIAKTQAGQQAQAQNQLAMGGGLRSGARERLAAQSMQGGLAARQQALGSIGQQDEATRQKWLGMAPGLALQQAQHGEGIQSKNIQNTMLELAQKRATESGNYMEAMKEWGAANTAAATPSGGGGKK